MLSMTRNDFNLPNLPERPSAPIAVLKINIDETTASSNDTFDRGMSPSLINETLQESSPLSPNKNTFGNPLPSCPSDVPSEFHFPREEVQMGMLTNESESVRVRKQQE